MTETNTSSPKLSDALRALMKPAFDARALLQGAMSLLDEAESLDDQCGDIWAARQLVAEAWKKMEEIYGDKEIALLNRLIELEEVAR